MELGMNVSYSRRENSMSETAKRTFSLPAKQAKFIDKQVASGAYASASEVVRAGLRALQERDAAVDRWLNEEVAPVYDAMTADPQRALSANKVFAAVRARHAARLKAAKRET
jgi:antitoxin ParD1/3/4